MCGCHVYFLLKTQKGNEKYTVFGASNTHPCFALNNGLI